MGFQKWVVDALFKSPKFVEDMAGIIKIVIALNPKKKLDGTSPQSGFSRKMSQGNECK